jgi:hypothetical protein
MLEELLKHRGVQGLKKRTSEHEGKGSGATPPEQIQPRPVNGQRYTDLVYQDLLDVLKDRGGPYGTVHEGLDKVKTGSQESLNDSGLGSPPPSPTQPESPVALNPAARDRANGAYSRFGVWHSDTQREVLNQIAVTLGPRRGESGA